MGDGRWSIFGRSPRWETGDTPNLPAEWEMREMYRELPHLSLEDGRKRDYFFLDISDYMKFDIFIETLTQGLS